MQAFDYDVFDISNSDAESGLSLDQAIACSARMKEEEPGTFFRIIPSNSSATRFMVNKVSADEIYADALSRIARRAASIFGRRKRSA